MLPRKFLNPQMTPATGLIINKMVDKSSLVLIEEVWQFHGFPDVSLTEMCFPSGNIKQMNWGWQELPSLINPDEYLVIPAKPHNLMKPGSVTLNAMIQKSIMDFKELNGFI